MRSLLRPRTVLPFLVAVGVGLFLAVASRALDWSEATTLVVGGALVAVLALFGTPLMLLPLDHKAADIQADASKTTARRRAENKAEYNSYEPHFTHVGDVTANSLPAIWDRRIHHAHSNLLLSSHVHGASFMNVRLRSISPSENSKVGGVRVQLHEARNPSASQEQDLLKALNSIGFSSNSPEPADRPELARAVGG